MNKNRLLVAFMMIVSMLTISSVPVFAQSENGNSNYMVQTVLDMQQKHDAVRQAILDNDYDTWYKLITENGKNPEILNIINKDNFAKFSEAHKKMEEARKMFEAMGIEKKMGQGMGKGMGNGMGKNQGKKMGKNMGKKLNKDCINNEQ